LKFGRLFRCLSHNSEKARMRRAIGIFLSLGAKLVFFQIQKGLGEPSDPPPYKRWLIVEI
jgi:hypothetical protein